MRRRSVGVAAAIALAAVIRSPGAAADPATARFAIVIGNNQAHDPSVVPLRYADDDALATYLLLREAGVEATLLTRQDEASRRLHPLAPARPAHRRLARRPQPRRHRRVQVVLPGLRQGRRRPARAVRPILRASCEETGLCIDDQASCAHQDGDGSPGVWRSGLQHPSCAQPVPDELPALPAINTDAAGRPLFDYWRDLEPGSYEENLCETSNTCPDVGSCVQLAEGTSEGVCMSADTDIWCDGEGEVLSWMDGGCWMCAPLESHAAACAAEIPGVDCRTWPYPSNGATGAVCAAHEDCEPGLVCGPASDEGRNGYGLCQCPGLTSAPRPHPAC